MSLQEQMEAKRQEFQSSASQEILQVMGRAAKELIESGIMDRVLKEGDQAPDFTLINAQGTPVNLKERLSTGPVVLGFYRGRW